MAKTQYPPATFIKYLSYGALALLIYMPFHIFLSLCLSTFTGGLDAWKIGKDIFAAALTLIIVLTVLFTRRYTRTFLIMLGLTVVYTILHLILLFATDQTYDIGLLATVYNTRLFWFALIGYGLALLAGNAINAKKLVKILIGVSAVVCLVALIQWIAPKDLMTHFGYSVERGVKPAFFIDDKTDLPRVMSTIRDPNSLGAFLILPITLLTYGLIRFWNTNRRMFLSGLLALHLLILFLTFSRSAWLGTFVAIFLVISFVHASSLKNVLRKFAVPIAIGLVLIAGLVFMLRDQYVVQNIILHSDENTQQADSNELHLSQLDKGLEGIAKEPLGNGPGTAGLVSIHNEKGGLLTENYFVQVGYEVGLLGLALMLGLMAYVVKKLWQVRKAPLALALIAGFIGISIMNMLLHTWANEAVATSWFLISGFMLGERHSQ